MPKKKVVLNLNTTDNNKSLTWGLKTVLKIFENSFSILAESLLGKLPDSSNKNNLESVFLYDSNTTILEVLHIKNTSQEEVFKIMENIEIFKAVGIETNILEYI